MQFYLLCVNSLSLLGLPRALRGAAGAEDGAPGAAASPARPCGLFSQNGFGAKCWLSGACRTAAVFAHLFHQQIVILLRASGYADEAAVETGKISCVADHDALL